MNELSIIVPCMSSLDVLPKFLGELTNYVMANPSDIEIIIVTDTEFDSNTPVIKFVRNKYPWLKFRMLQRLGESHNYGALARLGIACSTGRYVVLVSPYGEDDISNIGKMLNMIRKDLQVVQASRYALPEDSGTVPLKFRTYQNIYRFFIKVFTGYNISDSTYGFKMFDRIFIQALGLTQNGRGISPEITLKAILAGGKVEFLPTGVRLRQIGAKFKIGKDGFGYLWLLVRCVGHRTKLVYWF